MLVKKQIKEIKTEIKKSGGQFPLIFEALGDQGRFLVFKFLIKHHDFCVTDIAKVFNITISAVSQQLKILERVGLVQRIRKGQMVCYEVRNDPVTKYIVGLLKVESKSIFNK